MLGIKHYLKFLKDTMFRSLDPPSPSGRNNNDRGSTLLGLYKQLACIRNVVTSAAFCLEDEGTWLIEFLCF